MKTSASGPCQDDNSYAFSLARDLVLRYGWNSTCYQILNPGIELWFSSKKDAVIGYVSCGKVAVVVGAPVCHVEQMESVLEEWHAELGKQGKRACYFGAEQRLNEILGKDERFKKVILGAQPVWDLGKFLIAMRGDASLRYQLNRARNKGVRIEEWPTVKAAGNPQLQKILHEWLETRGLPPMHFMVEPYTLDCLADRRLFVAVKEGEPVGFVVLTPVPKRTGWLTEQFVRGFKAPNGTIELLLSEAANTICASGSEFITMGIVPLSNHGNLQASPNPKWLDWFMTWFRAHGRRFYNFDGLDKFKCKFHPDYWEPIYAISMEPQFSISTLYAIASAFCRSSPILAAAGGFGRAARQEWSWATSDRRRGK